MRLRAWIWLVCAALLLAATVTRFLPQPPIETDLLALLPPTERNPLAEHAATQLGRLTGERAVFLVGLPNDTDVRAAAALLAERLTGNGTLFKRVARIGEAYPVAHDHYFTAEAVADLARRVAALNVRDGMARAATLRDEIVSTAVLLRVRAEFALGREAAALETLKKAYAKQPDAEIAAHIGEVLWKLGRTDEAKDVWRDAAKVYPSNEALNATIKRHMP